MCEVSEGVATKVSLAITVLSATFTKLAEQLNYSIILSLNSVNSANWKYSEVLWSQWKFTIDHSIMVRFYHLTKMFYHLTMTEWPMAYFHSLYRYLTVCSICWIHWTYLFLQNSDLVRWHFLVEIFDKVMFHQYVCITLWLLFVKCQGQKFTVPNSEIRTSIERNEGIIEKLEWKSNRPIFETKNPSRMAVLCKLWIHARHCNYIEFLHIFTMVSLFQLQLRLFSFSCLNLWNPEAVKP